MLQSNESPRFSRKVDGSIIITLHIAIPKQRILHHDSSCIELESTNRCAPSLYRRCHHYYVVGFYWMSGPEFAKIKSMKSRRSEGFSKRGFDQENNDRKIRKVAKLEFSKPSVESLFERFLKKEGFSKKPRTTKLLSVEAALDWSRGPHPTASLKSKEHFFVQSKGLKLHRQSTTAFRYGCWGAPERLRGAPNVPKTPGTAKGHRRVMYQRQVETVTGTTGIRIRVAVDQRRMSIAVHRPMG
jgi:hypothetical protein